MNANNLFHQVLFVEDIHPMRGNHDPPFLRLRIFHDKSKPLQDSLRCLVRNLDARICGGKISVHGHDLPLQILQGENIRKSGDLETFRAPFL